MKRGIFLLYADLDNLKKINDNYGHRIGDLALVDIAQVMKETFRDPDIIARIGGDEFVVLAIEGLEEANPETLISRLNQNLSVRNQKKDRPYTLSLSMGVAYQDPGKPYSIDQLLSTADQCMYEQKKEKGRRNG
jgi:diguanylate cyclase (GGDEF)-like protein